MIKFAQDFSDPEVLNLLMKKSLERQANKRSLLLRQLQKNEKRIEKRDWFIQKLQV